MTHGRDSGPAATVSEDARSPRIKSAGRGWWAALFKKEAARLAKVPDGASTDVRLLLAALGRANNSGHACFVAGELADILATVNQHTGVLTPLDRTSVSRAIKRAVKAGVLAPGSGPQCLLLPWELWQGAKGGTPECRVHRTRRPYFRETGWGEEPEPDPEPE